MIRLDRTTRTLGIVLGGAVATNQLNVIVSGIERGPSSAATQAPVLGFTQISTTNDTTDVTICAAPGVTGRVREVESISVRNRDTAAVVVSIEFDDNGTDYIIFSATLSIGDFLTYSSQSGWQVFDSTGQAKVSSTFTVGMVIGDSVTGGTDTRVLVTKTGPVLGDDANFTYNYTTDVLTVNGSTFGTNTKIGGTLEVTGAVTLTVPLPLTGGGTNASLTASNGGIFYSTATAGAILAGTATAGQVLRSGASTTPSWSTATYPATATGTGTILRADGTNWVATTATYPTTVTDDQVLYGTATNVVGGSANLLFDGTTLTANTLTVGPGQLIIQSQFKVQANSPEFDFKKNNGSVDGKVWRFEGVTDQILSFRTVNDAESDGRTWLEVVRSGMTISSIKLNTGATPTTALTLDSSQNATLAGNLTVTGNQLIGSAVGTLRSPDGCRIGADSTNNLLDDASNGAGTAALYIGNAQITAVSDSRLKRDREPTKRDGLAIIEALAVEDFYYADPSDCSLWNRNSRGKTMGIVAQQAVTYVPWLVNAPDRHCPQCLAGELCDRHDSHWQFDYALLSAVNTRAIQQLNARMKAAGI